MGPDVHLFRQDVDTYLLSVAASYGATIRQRTDVTDVAFRSHGAELRTRDGATFEAKYVIDAGGVKAPVAHALGLRMANPEMATHSRSIYTHMQGVLPFDACIAGPEEHELASPLSQGTLHHLFDGGWMWVIPFDNHPTSTNRLVSVGLNLDPRKHPPTGLPPAEEFRRFVAKYPALAKQFERAIAIRDWVSTDRTQFNSTCAVGDRFCLIPHAFAFVDPLFSSGLTIAMNVVNMLALRLIAAQKDGDYSAARFAPVDARVKDSFAYFDKLVSRSYLAFSDFELWNAWFKVWAIGGVLGSSGPLEVLGHYRRRGDASAFELSDDPLYAKVQATGLPEYAALFDDTGRTMDAFGEGRVSLSATTEAVHDRIAASRLWPGPWGKDGVRSRSVASFTLPNLVKTIAWIKRTGPACLRETYFNRFSLPDVLSMAANDLTDEIRSSGGAMATTTRDYLVGYNRDWQRPS
jgi:FADH2 O2-dependent halogenase